MTWDDPPSPSSPEALDVFALRVVGEYRRFATSFTAIHAPDIREQVDAIYAGNRYWPEPLIQINPRRSTDVGVRVANGVLDPGCAAVSLAHDDAPPAKPNEADEDAHGTHPEGEYGSLTPLDDPDFRFADRDEDCPETWIELTAAGHPRIKPRDARALLDDHLRVREAGRATGSASAQGLPRPDVIGVYVLLPKVD